MLEAPVYRGRGLAVLLNLRTLGTVGSFVPPVNGSCLPALALWHCDTDPPFSPRAREYVPGSTLPLHLFSELVPRERSTSLLLHLHLFPAHLW